jgi:hypothetical protein
MSKHRWTASHAEADKFVRGLIPEHLNADELIANSWDNAGSTETETPEREVEVFLSTAEMYIDQDCSTF